MKFTYVNIASKGCEGWLNLFFGDHVIALVDNVWLANQIRAEIQEKNNQSFKSAACNCFSGVPQTTGGCPVHGCKLSKLSRTA